VRPDPYAWTLHPEASLAIVVLAGIYVFGTRRFAVGRWRAGAFAGGIALLLATAVTPLDALSYHVLTMHLLQNVVLAEWAPALLVLGLPPALAGRFRPHPLLTLPVWIGTYFLWHLPPLYDAALRHDALLHLEHASYLAAGALLWWPVLQGDRPPQQRAAYVFAGFVLASPLGLLLALLPDAIYESYEDGFPDWGLDALQDQQIAGVTMAGEQAVVFFAVFAFYFFRFLAAEEAG
jgi:putative membrane protein